jgi:chitodextrinase
MKPVSLAVALLLAGLPLLAAPGAFTLSGSAFCSNANTAQPGVHLTWTTSANATQYDVYMAGQDASIGSVPAGESNTFDTTYFAAIDQTRSYHLIARDGSGGTSTSNSVDVFIPGDVCPPGPFTVSGNASCDSGTPAVHLSWGSSTQQPTFRVYRDGTQISGDLNWTNQSFTDKSAVAGRSYTYTVTASNGSKSTTTPPLNITISSTICSGGSPPPGAFSASVSSFCTNGTPGARVTWTPSSGATSYVVNRNGAPVSGMLSSGTSSYDDATASSGHSSSYVVVASNSSGSTPATAGDVVPSCPPPAFSLTATAACSASAPPLPVITLNWSAAGTATSYLIIRDGMQAGSVNGSTTTFTDTEAMAGQTYQYVVRAVGPGGDTDSNSVSIATDPAICGAPPCDLSCSASVAAAGVTGDHISFALLQAPSCSQFYVSWTFGDSTYVNEVAPTHVYASPGTYTWSVAVVGLGGHTCTNSGTITVTSAAPQIPPKRRAARH